MAKGQEIEELYISLGLDIDDLKLGFDTAGKTVSQAITRLNSENKKIQLKTDIDLSKLEGVGTELDKIKLRYEAINKQLDIQRQKEAILQAQLHRATKYYGADHGLTQRAQMNLLYQQKNVATLEAQLRNLGTAFHQETPKATSFFSSVANGANRAKASVGGLGSSYTLLSTKVAALMAVTSTGAGLFSVTDSAMNAGQATYRLTQRLHISAAEAGQLSRVFRLAGTDINTITPFIARLDKQLMTAGENGNNTTKALDQFGISLVDKEGKLLSINEQLSQLAKGYENAVKANEEEAFTAEVLGGKGAALIPVLQDYNDLMTVSQGIKTTGLLNPDEAHETWLEWQKMSMELGQLKLALGSALLPVTKDLMPDVVSLFQNMVQLIRDNKDAIVLLGESIVDAMCIAKDILGEVSDALDAVGINAKNVSEVFGNLKAMSDAWQKHDLFLGTSVGALLGGAAGSMVLPGLGTTVGALLGGGAGLATIYEGLQYTDGLKEHKAENDAEKAERERPKPTKETSPASSNITAQQIAKEAEEAAKATTELKESLYSLSHSDLETALHNVDESLKKYKERGVSEVEIARAAEAQKAKIIKDFNDQVAQSIDSIWKSDFQNRLDQIEREKEAWKQKGLDEVKATEWAEEKKRQLQQETALHMFKEQFKYLQIYRNAMAGYGSEEDKRARAMERMTAQLRKDAGLPENAWTTRDEMLGFSELYRNAKEQMVPIYDTAPSRYIMKGMDAIPMFPPEYTANMRKLSQVTPVPQQSAKQQDVNYHLEVNVTGLEDVGNKVAQTAAKKILDRLPNSNRFAVSYGS